MRDKQSLAKKLMDWLSNGNQSASKNDENLLSTNSKLIEFLRLKASTPLTPGEIEMMTSILAGKLDATLNERMDRALEKLKNNIDSPVKNQAASTFASVIGPFDLEAA